MTHSGIAHTTFLVWMPPSAGTANSQPGEQQQSCGHQSPSCAIGSLKSQVYLPIDLLSSVKLRKTQDKHKRRSASRLGERRPNSSNSPEQGWASAWLGKTKPNCSQNANLSFNMSPGAPARGARSTPRCQHPRAPPGFLGAAAGEGLQIPLPNLSSNVARNDKENLKDFPPSTKITSQSRCVLDNSTQHY